MSRPTTSTIVTTFARTVRSSARRCLVLAFVLAALAVASPAVNLALPGAASAQDSGATVRADGKQSGDELALTVLVDDAHNLGAFQMVLSWDSNVLSLTDVASSSDFLASSGRQPYCPDPTTDPSAFR